VQGSIQRLIFQDMKFQGVMLQGVVLHPKLCSILTFDVSLWFGIATVRLESSQFRSDDPGLIVYVSAEVAGLPGVQGSRDCLIRV
jgi:hypothetical protein